MRRRPLTVIILLVASAMPGCSMLNHEAPTEDADKAAVLFFQRLDKEEYDQIYNDSAKKFKETKTRQSVIESLQEITAYGKTIEYQRKSMPIQAEAKILSLIHI